MKKNNVKIKNLKSIIELSDKEKMNIKGGTGGTRVIDDGSGGGCIPGLNLPGTPSFQLPTTLP